MKLSITMLIEFLNYILRACIMIMVNSFKFLRYYTLMSLISSFVVLIPRNLGTRPYILVSSTCNQMGGLRLLRLDVPELPGVRLPGLGGSPLDLAYPPRSTGPKYSRGLGAGDPQSTAE